jgi:hypothetical protein
MPIEVVVLALAGMSMVTGLGFGMMRSINRHLERKYGSPDAQRFEAELEELRAAIGGMEDVRHRLTELEERLDFAERLLSRGPQLDR